MGVTIKNLKKWPLPIPYESANQLEQEVLDNFNQEIRHTFFVRHNGSADVTVLRFDSANAGKCHIGFIEGEKVRIVAYRPGQDRVDDLSKARTLLHELGHCIGLAHEQCHGDYAWDYREEIKNSLTHRPKMPLNKKIDEAFGKYPDKGIFFMKMIAIAQERERGQYTDITSHCDYESIMMYDIYHTVALDAKNALPEPDATNDLPKKLNRIPRLPPTGRLSGNDVRTIRLLYAL